MALKRAGVALEVQGFDAYIRKMEQLAKANQAFLASGGTAAGGTAAGGGAGASASIGGFIDQQGLQSSLDGVSGVFNKFFSGWQQLKMGFFTGIGRRLGRDLLVGIEDALRAGKEQLQAGFTAAVDFQAILGDVASTAHIPLSATSQIRSQIEQLAIDPRLVAGFEDINTAVVTLLQNGAKLPDIQGGLLEGALLLQNAVGKGEQDYATAAMVLQRAEKLFNIAPDQSANAASIITEMVRSGGFKNGLQDVFYLLSNSGEVMQSLNVGLKEYGTLITAIGPSFASGRTEGTSASNFLAAIATPDDKAKAAMSALGLNFFDAQGSFIGLEAAALQLNHALTGTVKLSKQVGGRTEEESKQLKIASDRYNQLTSRIYQVEHGMTQLGRNDSLDNLRKQQAAAAAEMTRLQAITGQTITTFNQLSDAQRLAYIDDIFGSGSGMRNFVLAVAGVDQAVWDQTDALINNSNAWEAAAKRTANLKSAWENLKDTVQLDFVSLFFPADAPNTVVTSLETMVRRIQQILADAQPSIEQAGRDIGNALAPVAKAFDDILKFAFPQDPLKATQLTSINPRILEQELQPSIAPTSLDIDLGPLELSINKAIDGLELKKIELGGLVHYNFQNAGIETTTSISALWNDVQATIITTLGDKFFYANIGSHIRVTGTINSQGIDTMLEAFGTQLSAKLSSQGIDINLGSIRIHGTRDETGVSGAIEGLGTEISASLTPDSLDVNLGSVHVTGTADDSSITTLITGIGTQITATLTEDGFDANLGQIHVTGTADDTSITALITGIGTEISSSLSEKGLEVSLGKLKLTWLDNAWTLENDPQLDLSFDGTDLLAPLRDVQDFLVLLGTTDMPMIGPNSKALLAWTEGIRLLDDALQGVAAPDSGFSQFIGMVTLGSMVLAELFSGPEGAQVASDIGFTVSRIFTDTATFLSHVADFAGDNASTNIGNLSLLLQSIGTFVTDMVDAVDGQELAGATDKLSSRLIAQLSKSLTAADIPDLAHVASTFWKAITQTVAEAGSGENFALTGEEAGKFINTLFGELSATFEDPETAANFGTGAGDLVIGLIGAMNNALGGAQQELEKGEGVVGLAGSISTFVDNLVTALDSHLKAANFDSLGGTLVQKIYDAIAAALGISPPQVTGGDKRTTSQQRVEELNAQIATNAQEWENLRRTVEAQGGYVSPAQEQRRQELHDQYNQLSVERDKLTSFTWLSDTFGSWENFTKLFEDTNLTQYATPAELSQYQNLLTERERAASEGRTGDVKALTDQVQAMAAMFTERNATQTPWIGDWLADNYIWPYLTGKLDQTKQERNAQLEEQAQRAPTTPAEKTVQSIIDTTIRDAQIQAEITQAQTKALTETVGYWESINPSEQPIAPTDPSKRTITKVEETPPSEQAKFGQWLAYLAGAQIPNPYADAQQQRQQQQEINAAQAAESQVSPFTQSLYDFGQWLARMTRVAAPPAETGPYAPSPGAGMGDVEVLTTAPETPAVQAEPPAPLAPEKPAEKPTEAPTPDTPSAGALGMIESIILGLLNATATPVYAAEAQPPTPQPPLGNEYWDQFFASITPTTPYTPAPGAGLGDIEPPTAPAPAAEIPQPPGNEYWDQFFASMMPDPVVVQEKVTSQASGYWDNFFAQQQQQQQQILPDSAAIQEQAASEANGYWSNFFSQMQPDTSGVEQTITTAALAKADEFEMPEISAEMILALIDPKIPPLEWPEIPAPDLDAKVPVLNWGDFIQTTTVSVPVPVYYNASTPGGTTGSTTTGNTGGNDVVKPPNGKPFATGTRSFPGGLGLGGEQGEELYVTPEGNIGFIGLHGRELFTLPQGSQIYSAAQTSQILANSDVRPRYSMPESNVYYNNNRQSSPTTNTTKNYNLSVTSQQSTGRLADDFRRMEVLAGFN